MPYLTALRGLGWFLRHPRQWWRPLAAYALAGSMVLGLMAGVALAAWPAAATGWTWWWRGGAAVGLGLATGVAAWSLAVPVLLALAFDGLVAAVRSALVVVAGTLGLRLGMVLVALLGLLAGPLSPLVAAWALSRVAVVDAADTALAAEGLDGGQRLAGLRRMPGVDWRGALGAAGLKVLLAPTLLGWLLWMPALVAGAALVRLDDVPGDAPART